MSDKFGFRAKLIALQQVKIDLPNVLAQSGQRFFQQEFQKSEWNGQPWKPRKTITKKNKGKHLLVASGKLKQSLQNTVVNKDFKSIVWGVKSLDYAKYQNYGTANIPARKFLGGSPKLTALLKKKIEFQFNKILHAK